jgi:hypothetical protein
VQNPIPKSNLFTTPTLAEVQSFIDALPTKERANANLVFMFTLNACHQLVEEEHEDIVDVMRRG